jgi:hypothetical protein
MEKVVVDPETQAKLHGLTEQLMVADASGRMLGVFLPRDVYAPMLRAWLSSEPTAEELDAARTEKGGLDISQVLGHLADVERQWKERRG